MLSRFVKLSKLILLCCCLNFGFPRLMLGYEVVNNSDKFLHGPILKIIEVVSLGAEFQKVLGIVTRLNDVLP